MYYKYLIIQTDTEDYYVECLDNKFYERLCHSVPNTSELRGWHSSNDTEGSIELGHQGSIELFGRDIIAIAEGTIEPPWNPKTFREHLIKAVGEEHVHESTPNTILVTDNTLSPEKMTAENATILGMHNVMFFADICSNPIPWLRATDHDVAEVIKSAKQWLSEHMPDAAKEDRAAKTPACPEKPKIRGLLTYTPGGQTLHTEISLDDLKASLMENPPKVRYVTQGATLKETAQIIEQVIPTLEPDEMLIVDYADCIKIPDTTDNNN